MANERNTSVTKFSVWFVKSLCMISMRSECAQNHRAPILRGKTSQIADFGLLDSEIKAAHLLFWRTLSDTNLREQLTFLARTENTFELILPLLETEDLFRVEKIFA